MKKFIALISSFLLLAGCAGRNHEGEKSKAEYDKSLSDSISAIKSEIDSCNEQISFLRDRVGEWLHDFTTVTNPREAAPYIIMTSAKNQYPLKSTGIIARLNDSYQFELIAALSGKHFDCINVVSGSNSISSEVVPNDQALNYRTESLTTVSFTGGKADSIGQLISDNELNPLTLNFLNGGKPVQSVKINNNEAKIISYTYILYKDNKEMKRLEHRVPMLHEKINLIRLHQDKISVDSSKIN